MHQIKKKIIKGLVWSITIGSLTICVLLFLATQFSWRIKGNSTSVAYSVSPGESSLLSIHDVVRKIAQRHNLKPQVSKELPHFESWGRPKSFFYSDMFDMNLSIESYPRDETDTRKTKVYINITTRDASKTNEW